MWDSGTGFGMLDLRRLVPLEIRIRPGEKRMTVNGEAVRLDVPAQIVDGRTLVPFTMPYGHHMWRSRHIWCVLGADTCSISSANSKRWCRTSRFTTRRLRFFYLSTLTVRFSSAFPGRALTCRQVAL